MFPTVLVRKANAVEWEITWLCDITNVLNPCMWLMVWQWHHFLLASCRSVATDHLCQILWSQKLSHKSEKWCKFSSSVKAKSCRKKLYFTWQLASLFTESVLHDSRLCTTCCYSTLPLVLGSYTSIRSTAVLGTIFKEALGSVLL